MTLEKIEFIDLHRTQLYKVLKLIFDGFAYVYFCFNVLFSYSLYIFSKRLANLIKDSYLLMVVKRSRHFLWNLNILYTEYLFKNCALTKFVSRDVRFTDILTYFKKNRIKKSTIITRTICNYKYNKFSLCIFAIHVSKFNT